MPQFFVNKRPFLQFCGGGFVWFWGCLVCLFVGLFFISNRRRPWQRLVFLPFFYIDIFKACHQIPSERMWHSIHSAAYAGLSYSLKKELNTTNNAPLNWEAHKFQGETKCQKEWGSQKSWHTRYMWTQAWKFSAILKLPVRESKRFL